MHQRRCAARMAAMGVAPVTDVDRVCRVASNDASETMIFAPEAGSGVALALGGPHPGGGRP